MQGKGLPNVSVMHGKSQLELLRGISGSFRPGILTCLMGVSGAGKTTLMDVLSGRKTGQQTTHGGAPVLSPQPIPDPVMAVSQKGTSKWTTGKKQAT